MSRWTHAICDTCWSARNGGRAPVHLREPDLEICCFCGGPTKRGIYVRHDPAELRCRGTHAA